MEKLLLTFEAAVRFFGSRPVWLLFSPEERRAIMIAYARRHG